MLHKFKAYLLAVQLYEECQSLKAPRYLKDQLSRASLSVVLNLAEGSAKPTVEDRMKFYAIAFGSCRETQALLMILKSDSVIRLADQVGACLYRLPHPLPKG